MKPKELNWRYWINKDKSHDGLLIYESLDADTCLGKIEVSLDDDIKVGYYYSIYLSNVCIGRYFLLDEAKSFVQKLHNESLLKWFE